MSERPGKLGFQFIPNPEGGALADRELLSSALAQQKEKSHQNMLLAFDFVAVAVICLGLVLALRKLATRRTK